MQATKSQIIKLDLPGGEITIGPGTVPLSTASVRQTSIKDMSSGLRKASRLGIFDTSAQGKISD